MALVCDIKSDNPETAAEPVRETGAVVNEDLEDGEIEDDEEEVLITEIIPETTTTTENSDTPSIQESNTNQIESTSPTNNKFSHNSSRLNRYDRGDRHRHDDRKRGHLTEAEKSVMHLHKLERLEREKREKYKRDQAAVVDDFASNIEKAIASILKKDKQKPDDDDSEGDKRGKKRKKKDKEKKKAKQRRSDSPLTDNFEASDTNLKICDNLRVSPAHSDSYDSNSSSDRKQEHSSKKRSHSKTRERSRHGDKKHKSNTKSREQKTDHQLKPPEGGICLFYLQGKCNLGEDCMFSHDIQVPMKLELCKFYVMECCAKGENCSYMHSTFPCKFYHMGLACKAGDSCKFAHGKPLSDGLKQILFKHIETAPKEILGEFPRLNRDGTLAMLNQAQRVLDVKYGGEKAEVPGGIPHLLDMNIPMPMEFVPKDGDLKVKDKKERNRPSRWQDPDPTEQETPAELNFGLSGFYTERGDQDMRITSNGDIDMRTLPQISTILQTVAANLCIPDIQSTGDVDIRGLPPSDTDIRFEPPLHLLQNNNGQIVEESKSEIIVEENASTEEHVKSDIDFPPNLPKKQRELFLRIQSHQKDHVLETQKSITSDEDKNIDWYSDDDDDGRLMIKDDIEEPTKKTDEQMHVPHISPDIKPVEVLEKLGDLSKIDISVEVTKLLSSLSQSGILAQPVQESKILIPEIVIPKSDVKVQPSKHSQPIDPRKSRRDSNETRKTEKLSIYEQGSISLEGTVKDTDLRNLDKDTDFRIGQDFDFRSTLGRPDVDLRNLGLPFKPMQNYTPATEIDASIQSHPPIPWRIHLVDIPQPNYTGLKLSANDAKNVGDPRLRKIFRLSTEENESPASPTKDSIPSLSSPKAAGIRSDPRLRKVEEKPMIENLLPSQLNYAQQLTMLQTSVFYQSLTSNQKVLLNQELAERVENSATNANDPTLNGILSNLGLIPGSASASPVISNSSAAANANALNILANVNSLLVQSQNQQFLNPLVSTLAQTMVQQSTNLGIANLPPDFQLNFDPRQGGLLGNAPPFTFNDNSNSYSNGNNYTDDYYDEPSVLSNTSVRGRGGRGSFRGDRQHQNRRGRNFGRNTGNRNFRNRNRNSNNNIGNINNNRSRTSP